MGMGLDASLDRKIGDEIAKRDVAAGRLSQETASRAKLEQLAMAIGLPPIDPEVVADVGKVRDEETKAFLAAAEVK